MNTATVSDVLCRELDVAWSDADHRRLNAELRPFVTLITRHVESGAEIPSHLPGTGSICTPITSITDPYELYRDAAGAVNQEQFSVQTFEDYWITTHVSAVPVVILLSKRNFAPFPSLEELCARCTRVLGEPVGSNCYLQCNLPGFAWQLHTDDDYEGVSSRVHVPLITTPQNLFAWAPALDSPRPAWLLELHLEAGHAYVTRTDVPHTAINEHPTDARIHLIIDVGPTSR